MTGAPPTPRRVLHVVPYYAGADAYGGIPRVAAGLTRALARRGCRVTVCTTDARDRERRHPASGRTLLVGGVRTVFFPNLDNRLAFAQVFLPPGALLWLARHVRAFDLVHLHGHRHLLNEVAAAAARAAGVPYVLQANGTLPVLERRQRLKRLYDLAAGWATVRGAACGLATSRVEVEQYRSAGLPGARIVELPNGLDPEEFRALPARAGLRERLGLNGVPLVVFLGKATPRKNVPTLVEALARPPLAGAHLLVAGSDMGGLDAARQRVRALGLEDRVHFLGPQEGRDRLAPLVAADVVAYAGAHEIFGLVPFEALLCGAPVVVANDSGCGQWIGDHDLGVTVPPGDAEALAGALAGVLREPARARARVRDAQRFIRQRLAWDRVARELERVYDRVVKR